MLANLLPGLRELRTPLAAGYLVLTYLGLVSASRLQAEHNSALASDLNELKHLGLGATGWLAVLSFLAYLVGATYEGVFWAVGGLLFRQVAKRVDPLGGWWLRWPWIRTEQSAQLKAMVRSSLGRRTQEQTGKRLTAVARLKDLVHKLAHGPGDGHDEKLNDRLKELLDELYTAPIRLISEKRDLWTEWDRLDAEARFRITISLPVTFAGIATTDALSSLTGWGTWASWVGWVVVGITLGLLGVRKGHDATEVLLQALQAGELGEMKSLRPTSGWRTDAAATRRIKARTVAQRRR